ncbi:lymphocyte antigen 96 isoform X7 [Mauremys reevesii]|uniref:lymphocyte antigen 96 isoform X7 n=1 Tax=Mauremys reevesii TaxID=260615 RepID=UPI00193ED6A7|nr:lymphocyte antigen 96 isoform X7 [Mauremys reevesii]
MFQLVFFILFTSGFTESQGKKVLCSSSDVEISYSFCDSMDDAFFLSIVPCSFSESRWKVTLLSIPKTLNTTFEIGGLKMKLPKMGMLLEEEKTIRRESKCLKGFLSFFLPMASTLPEEQRKQHWTGGRILTERISQ